MASQSLKVGLIIFVVLAAIAVILFSSYALLSSMDFGNPDSSQGSVASNPDSGIAAAPGSTTGPDADAVIKSFNDHVAAAQKCDIQATNSLSTKKSLEILRPTCSNLKGEAQCYINKRVE
ncbi:MAG: hypothetical protein ABIF01_05845, partial [Candidatus Micrarchaeota archaeon]